MKRCRKCETDKDEGEFYPRERSCKTCRGLQNAAWAEKNREKVLSIKAAWRARHRATIQARESARRAASPERQRELRKKYYNNVVKARPEIERAKQRRRYQNNREARIRSSVAWGQRNPHKAGENQSLHRAQCRKARPQWSNRFFMQEIYDLAIRRTKVTGMEWTVDHIVPLRHKLVCGLHCEQNMAVILKSVNSSKGNRRWPDMWE